MDETFGEDAGDDLPLRAVAIVLEVPLGVEPAKVRAWFDQVIAAVLPAGDDSLAAEHEAAEAFQRLAKAENTRSAYRSGVRAWCAWCFKRGVSALPGAGRDVAAFLAAERKIGLSPNTLNLRRASIRYLHRIAGAAVPTEDACVSETLAGIRRDSVVKGERPKKKVAAREVIIRQILASIPDDVRGLRDRAMLTVGYAGALRRSELAGIMVEDLEHVERGIRLRLKQTKGSQMEEVFVPLPYGKTELCPVQALDRWIEAAGITTGPIFRRIWVGNKSENGKSEVGYKIGSEPITTRSVGRMVQERAQASGLVGERFGGHSLKRGAITTGMDKKVHPTALKRLGRHKTFEVLGEYLEFGDGFEGHPLGDVL